MLKKETLHNLVDLTMQNAKRNKESEVLACFYCKDVFHSAYIVPEERIDENPGKPKTDRCPICGIDSVISIDYILDTLNKSMFDY